MTGPGTACISRLERANRSSAGHPPDPGVVIRRLASKTGSGRTGVAGLTDLEPAFPGQPARPGFVYRRWWLAWSSFQVQKVWKAGTVTISTPPGASTRGPVRRAAASGCAPARRAGKHRPSAAPLEVQQVNPDTA